MSTQFMSACWPLQIPPTPKMVLMSLADNANDTGVCWPSIDTISTRTCLHRATVIRAIHFLELAGYIVADRSNGRHTRYTVIPQGVLFDVAKARSAIHRPEETAAEHDPSQSAIGSTARPDSSHIATGPVAQCDTNRKEPTRTIYPSRAREAGPEPEIPSAALATRAMIEAGIPPTRANPSHPELLSALAEGVTPAELADVVREFSRGADPPHMTYVIRTAVGRRRNSTREMNYAKYEAHPHPRRVARSAVGRQLEAIQRRRAREAAGIDLSGAFVAGEDG